MARVQRNLSVTTPQIVEQVASILRVDSKTEFYIVRGNDDEYLYQVRVIKLTLEAYVEKQFDLTTFLSDMATPINWLR
jgi:hypothetical protein